MVGAKSNPQASSLASRCNKTLAVLPSGESGEDVSATSGHPRFFSAGNSPRISSLLPLLDKHMTTSSDSTAPRSPCSASPAWINMDRVPVEFMVAAILAAMCALFPTPVSTIFPVELDNSSTACWNCIPRELDALRSACDARASVRCPISMSRCGRDDCACEKVGWLTTLDYVYLMSKANAYR